MKKAGSSSEPTEVQVEGKPFHVNGMVLTPRMQVETRKSNGTSGGYMSVKAVPSEVGVEQDDEVYEIATGAADDTPLRALAVIAMAVMIVCLLVVGLARLRLRVGHQ